MNYGTRAYNDPDAPKTTIKSMFGGGQMTLPKFNYPISPVENLKRSARHDKPLWVPNSMLDTQTISPNDMILPTGATRGQCVCMDFSHPHTADYTFTDWFLTDWTYVHSAGGPMLTPGFKQCDDVVDWEKAVKFPKLSDWDWDTFRDGFMKNGYDPDRALSCDIGLGCSERFVSIMGGYTEAMIAFATEPEACRAFFEAFIDHEIEQFDKMMEHYPITWLTYHDDWGNEKDTFFSPKMLEELLFEPTKRFIDHVKARDVIFEFHSCGNITRFLPYFAELGVEYLQIQRRAVDFIKLKENWGTKLGYGGGIEGLDFGGPDPSGDELAPLIRKTIDMHASTGGFYMGMFLRDPEIIWNAANEVYSYSREFYAKENG